jgi:DNA processing protein
MSDLDEIRLARSALTTLAEPGDRATYNLVVEAGPVEALRQMLRAELADPAKRDAVAARLAAGDPRASAEAALARGVRLGARLVVPEDGDWPPQLGHLLGISRPNAHRTVDRETHPPLAFWVRGERSLTELLAQSVAVVGSRAATPYGVHVATELAYGLSERGWTVVSGGAYGIDAAAHRGALRGGGPTVAVLACGVERAYPLSNSALFDHITESGLVISEWPPGTDPQRHRFLIRNRVIAASTRGTVVVEAASRSGATQTLGRALALGRPAMVVPGPVTSAMSVGCHEMLREQREVRAVANVAHVLEEVGRIGADLAPQARGPEHPRDRLDDQAALVLEALPGSGTCGVDELAARAGVDVRTAMRKLSMLEVMGLVVPRDGGYSLPPRKARSKRATAP